MHHRVRRALPSAEPADRDRYLGVHRALTSGGDFRADGEEWEYEALGRRIFGRGYRQAATMFGGDRVCGESGPFLAATETPSVSADSTA